MHDYLHNSRVKCCCFVVLYKWVPSSQMNSSPVLFSESAMWRWVRCRVFVPIVPLTVSITPHSNCHLQHVSLQDFLTCGNTLNPVYVPVWRVHSKRVHYESTYSKIAITEYMAFYDIYKWYSCCIKFLFLYSSKQVGVHVCLSSSPAKHYLFKIQPVP